MANGRSAEPISLPNAPAISGLTFRWFRGPTDYPALLAIRLAAAEADALDPLSARDPVPTLADIERRYADVEPGSSNMLFAEVHDTPVGYYNVTWWQEEGNIHVYLHLGWLVPEWRGRGIGIAMLRSAEARCRELAAEHRASGTIVYATNAVATEREKIKLLEQADYVVVRRLADMALDDLAHLEEPALTSEVKLRPVEPGQYRAIYAVSRDAWAGLWGILRESDDAYEEFLNENVRVPGYDPSLWQVAWAGDQAVAAVKCRIRDGVGIVDSVATRRAWQRKGLARGLLLLGLRTLADRGITAVRIYTDADNSQGARALYESVGFRPSGAHMLYRKPMPYITPPSAPAT